MVTLVCFEPPGPHPQDGCNDSMMIQIVDPLLLDCHIAEEPPIPAPLHAKIGLGVIPPMSPSPLLSYPSCPWALSVAKLLLEQLQRVNNIDMIEKVGDDFLPLCMWVAQVNIEIVKKEGGKIPGVGCPGGAESIHPRHVSGHCL